MPGSNTSLTCHFTENVNQTKRDFTVFDPAEGIYFLNIGNLLRITFEIGVIESIVVCGF